MKPRPESFDDPPAFIAAKFSTVLGLLHHTILSVWRYHFHTVILQVIIETVAVVGSVTDQFLRLCFDHVEVKGQLDERNCMVIRSMRGDGKRQAIAVHDTHDFHAFSRFVGPMPSPPPLAGEKVASMKLSRSSMMPDSRSVFAS